MDRLSRFLLIVAAASLVGAAGCSESRVRGIGTASGPAPKVHGVFPSPDRQWQLTLVERHPEDPDLHGTTWQLLLAPIGMAPDSAKPVFDAQDVVPAPTWRTADSVDVVATGPADKLTAMPPSWRTSETVLGRDGQRHGFAFSVVTKAK
jgi:hypothetical protein